MLQYIIIGFIGTSGVLYWACRDVNKIFIISMILLVTWFLGNAENILIFCNNHGMSFN